MDDNIIAGTTGKSLVRQEISTIRNEVLELMRSTIESLFLPDKLKRNFIIEKYSRITEMQNKIEKLIISKIQEESPNAEVLKSMVSTIRIAVHLERIAARCKHIALSEIALPTKELKKDLLKIKDMLETCMKIFTGILEGYEEDDMVRIRRISVKNLEVYSLYSRFNIRICSQIKKNPDKVEEYLKLINMNRDIERLATHVLNISEWIYSQVTGEELNLQIRESLDDE